MCDRYEKEEQLFSKKYDEYIQLLKSTLSKKRFIHSINVASMCLSLAKKHGADAEKAYLAGLGRVLTRGASASDPLTGFLRD